VELGWNWGQTLNCIYDPISTISHYFPISLLFPIDAARFASEGNAYVVAERSCEAASEDDACYDPG